MRTQNRGWTGGAGRRLAVGAAGVALLAGLAVGPAQAGDRGSGGVVKPVKPISGCSAKLRGDRAEAYWSNVAYRTGEFQIARTAAPTQSVRRAAGAGRLSQHAVGFDGRDSEGLWLSHATVGYDLNAGGLLVTSPLYPANTADDVARPGFGVDWSSRPIVGGVGNAAPYATDAARYGAYGAEDAVALVRVGPYVVPVDPWTPVSQDGSRATREVRERLERGRQEWLRERGFIGQVRTFVNDAAVTSRTGAARVDRPVAKFVGVSRTSDVAASSEETGTAEGSEAPGTERSEKMDEAPGKAAGIFLNQKPITRISMPHSAGLKGAGLRVIRADAPAKADGDTMKGE